MFEYKYPRPAVTVDAIIFKENTHELLLIQRKNDPFAGQWAFPGGFMDMDERLETACLRELFEETGLVASAIKFFCMADEVNRDPRGRTLSAVFYGFVPDNAIVKGGDDAKQAAWFSIDDLPELAFDHQLIIEKVLAQIKW